MRSILLGKQGMTEHCGAVLRLTKGKPLSYRAGTHKRVHTRVKGLRFLHQPLKKTVSVCKCVADLDLDDMYKKENA